ncbi:MAG: hypothetical protein M1491_05755 [Deltaproteobacteria bacterium]|nr:hypothetical protein [Deltaproteobacteria bacterium]
MDDILSEENIRTDAIAYYLEAERIYPPGIPFDHPFIKALKEVLERLPDDIYYIVEDKIWFTVEDIETMYGINVPFKQTCLPSEERIEIDIVNIIIFSECLRLEHKAIVGVISHEIAHTIVGYPKDPLSVERLTDELAIKWGFKAEIDAKEATKVKRQGYS